MRALFKTALLAAFCAASQIFAAHDGARFFFTAFKEARYERVPWARDIYIARSAKEPDITALGSAKIGGAYVLAVGFENCVALWSLETLTPLKFYRGAEVGGNVNALCVSGADGAIYAAVGEAGAKGVVLRLLNGKSETLESAADSFYALALSADFALLAGGAFDGTVFVRDLAASKNLFKEKFKGARPTAFAFSADSKKLLIGYADGYIEMRAAKDSFKTPVAKFAAGGVVRGLAFAPQDSGYIAAAGDENQQCIVSESFADGFRRQLPFKGKIPQGMAFDSSTTRAAVPFNDGSVAYRPLRSLNKELSDSLGEDAAKADISGASDFLSDGGWLWCITQITPQAFAAGGENGRVFIWTRKFTAYPSAFILVLSADGSKWASFLKEAYAQASDPAIVSWKLFSERPPQPYKEAILRDAKYIPLFMKLALFEEENAELSKKAEDVLPAELIREYRPNFKTPAEIAADEQKAAQKKAEAQKKAAEQKKASSAQKKNAVKKEEAKKKPAASADSKKKDAAQNKDSSK